MRDRHQRNYKIDGRTMKIIVSKIEKRIEIYYDMDEYEIGVNVTPFKGEDNKWFADRAIMAIERLLVANKIDKSLMRYDSTLRFIVGILSGDENIKENKEYYKKRYDKRVKWYAVTDEEGIIKSGITLREISARFPRIYKKGSGVWEAREYVNNLRVVTYFYRGEDMVIENGWGWLMDEEG